MRGLPAFGGRLVWISSPAAAAGVRPHSRAALALQ